MKAKLVWILALGLAAAAAWYGYGRWYGKTPSKTAPAGQRRVLYYRCPMHPDYHSDKPGDCPICGMKLTPSYAEDRPAGPDGKILIPPEQQQRYGVRTGEAKFETASRTVRAVGKVVMDETRLARIHLKMDGWIEEVYADYIGQSVARGQPLASIYSPELLASQQEYLLALRAKQILTVSTVPGVASGNDSLVQAARRRLELWDLSSEQIAEVERTGRPIRAVTLYSPSAGYITERKAFPGQRVTPDTDLYTLADLSRVWVMADVFEFEAPGVRVGQTATVTPSYGPSRAYPARISYIQPVLDPATRTLKVRLELANPDLTWKPDMFANVDLRIDGAPGLFVAADAVLDSGTSKTVFVDLGDGRFEPRRVETGREFDGKVEIVRGLKAGERIVTSGTFLVDSESRLKSASAGVHDHDQPGH